MFPSRGETTEWQDVLARHGIIKAPEKPPTGDELMYEAMAQRAEEEASALDNKTLAELDEMEDDLDDDVLRRYREERMREMQQKQRAAKHSGVRHITKPDFITEVTESSKSGWVVCHLFKDSIATCTLLNRALDELAARHGEVKFVKIIGDHCIENYPDRLMPTLCLYHDGACVKQLVGAADYGGVRLNADTVEWVLSEFGVLSTELEEDPRGAVSQTKVTRGASARARSGGDNGDDDDDDDGDDDLIDD